MRYIIIILLFLAPDTFSRSRPVVHTNRHINYIKNLTLLTKAINSESVGEKYIDKMRTGSVILNRLHNGGFGKTLHDVIYHPNQFKGVNTKYFRIDTRTPAGLDSYRAARTLLKYGSILPENVLYFHNPKVGKDKKWMAKIRHRLYCKGEHHWYFTR